MGRGNSQTKWQHTITGTTDATHSRGRDSPDRASNHPERSGCEGREEARAGERVGCPQTLFGQSTGLPSWPISGWAKGVGVPLSGSHPLTSKSYFSALPGPPQSPALAKDIPPTPNKTHPQPQPSLSSTLPLPSPSTLKYIFFTAPLRGQGLPQKPPGSRPHYEPPTV